MRRRIRQATRRRPAAAARQLPTLPLMEFRSICRTAFRSGFSGFPRPPGERRARRHRRPAIALPPRRCSRPSSNSSQPLRTPQGRPQMERRRRIRKASLLPPIWRQAQSMDGIDVGLPNGYSAEVYHIDQASGGSASASSGTSDDQMVNTMEQLIANLSGYPATAASAYNKTATNASSATGSVPVA